MVGWLGTLWRRWGAVYRLYKSATPANIARQARELEHLAYLAECSTLPVQDVAPLRQLQEEMRQLVLMAAQPAFARLSQDRRQRIAQNIARSQQILISTMQLGLSPSDRIQ